MASTGASQYLRQPYARIIMPDDQGRYAAQILEFPGCFAEGASPEEAYGNLQEAAEDWIESAVAQGMAVPLPFATLGHSGTISLRLPKSLHRRAAELAHRDGVSLNQFLVAAIAARAGAEDLLSNIASKLDERLDRLQVPQLLLTQGVAIPIPPMTGMSGTPSALTPALHDIDVSRLAESTTFSHPQIQKLVDVRED